MNKGGNHLVGFTRLEAHESLDTGRQKQKWTAGFTLIETLIVLAVTGALFASAVLIINGRQAKTEFQTGVNSVQQQLQQIINETASGYFPDSGNFRCTGSGGGAPTITTGGSNAQGTNDGCIFMGKIMQFSPSDKPNSPANFIVYPLAGNRRVGNATGQEVSTLYGANGADPQAIPSLATTATLPAGFTLVKSNSTPGHANFAAVGFLESLGSYADTGGNSCNGLCSGAQQLSLYVVPTVSLGSSSAANIINGNGSIVSVTQVQLCFSNGSTNQSGLITIDSQMTVDLQIKTGLTC